MESSDSIDKSWDTSSDATKTAQRSDPTASAEPPASIPHGWMVNVAGRDVVEMPHAEVISKWRSGELSGKSLVWREGMESWAVLESVPAFQIVARPSQPVASARPLASPPPAPVRSKPAPLRLELSATDEVNPVAVYERPVATLVFDEAVEDDWKRAPKAREPSTVKRGSGSSRPPAPSLPPLAPRVIRSSPIPHDEPPPPPPLPPRASTAPARVSTAPARERLTVPGGLEAPSPAAPSKAPPRAGASAAPIGASSSPLLAAIAAAASNPAPAVVEAPAAPVSAAVAPSPPVPASFDEPSFSMRLRAARNVSLRAAVVACGASALVASLVTGLVVRSGSQRADRPPPAARPKVAAAAPAAPEPPPAALAQDKVAAPANEEPAPPSVDKVALTDLKVSEKAKTPSKARAWKPPPSSDGLSENGPAEKPVASPGRDDPERAVPDPGSDRSAKPANWNADPGF